MQQGLADYFRRELASAGFSSAQAAARIGCSPRTVRRWLANDASQMTVRGLVSLSDLLGLRIPQIRLWPAGQQYMVRPLRADAKFQAAVKYRLAKMLKAANTP